MKCTEGWVVEPHAGSRADSGRSSAQEPTAAGRLGTGLGLCFAEATMFEWIVAGVCDGCWDSGPCSTANRTATLQQRWPKSSRPVKPRTFTRATRSLRPNHSSSRLPPNRIATVTPLRGWIRASVNHGRVSCACNCHLRCVLPSFCCTAAFHCLVLPSRPLSTPISLRILPQLYAAGSS